MRSRADRRGLVLCLVVVTTKLFVLSQAWAPRSLLAYAAAHGRPEPGPFISAPCGGDDPLVQPSGEPLRLVTPAACTFLDYRRKIGCRGF
jgi:hypothetical protein